MTEKIRLIAVVGPTASGKTELGAKIAKALGGEVVSADSMQIYKGMEIASAAPTAEEMLGVPHHLISVIPPDRRFTVADYIAAADREIADIHAAGKQPVIVGGTGLYVDNLINHTVFKDENGTDEIRRKLKAEAEALGADALFERLKKIDPESAQKIESRDLRRIIRALEIYELHGKPKSVLDREAVSAPSPYSAVYIGLFWNDREKLRRRIDRRVDIMMENGLLAEAHKSFLSPCGSTAAQAIGHKEFFSFFRGDATLEECVERLKISTRQYAKRQMTWWRKNPEINLIAADETEDVFAAAMKIIENS